MKKRILITIVAILLSLIVGFFAGMIVQNGGVSGLFSFMKGEKEAETALVGQTVTVGKNTANVYEEPDVNSNVIYAMSNGETATCVEQDGEWLKLEILDDVFGYAHAQLFTLASEKDIAAEEEKKAAEAEPSYVTPNVNVLDIYAGESMDFDIVATVETGAVLELVEKGQTWSKVKTLDGKEGYVMTSDIVATEYDPDAMIVEVVNSFVNLRSEPSADSEKIGTMNEGETATYLGEEEGFYKIRLQDGTECYVSTDYTEMKNASGAAVTETQEEESAPTETESESEE